MVRSATPQPSLIDPGGAQAADILQQQNALRSQEMQNRESIAGRLQESQIGANAQTSAAQIGADADLARAGIAAGTARQQMAMEREAQIRSIAAEQAQQDADRRFTLRMHEEEQAFRRELENNRMNFEKGTIKDLRKWNEEIEKRKDEWLQRRQVEATKAATKMFSEFDKREETRAKGYDAARTTLEESAQWNEKKENFVSFVDTYSKSGPVEEDVERFTAPIITYLGQEKTTRYEPERFYGNLIEKAGLGKITTDMMMDKAKLDAAIDRGEVEIGDLVGYMTIVRAVKDKLYTMSGAADNKTSRKLSMLVETGEKIHSQFNMLLEESTSPKAYEVWKHSQKILSNKGVGSLLNEVFGKMGRWDPNEADRIVKSMLEEYGYGMDMSDKEMGISLGNR